MYNFLQRTSQNKTEEQEVHKEVINRIGDDPVVRR